LFAVIEANRGYLRQWLPWLDFNTSINDSVRFIEAQTQQAMREETIPLGIHHHQSLVGVVSYNWISAERSACGLGYWLAQSLQGKGIATRSVARLVQHAFDSMELSTVEIHVATGNQRSRKLAERMGFRAIGTHEQAEWLYDHHVDHVVYALVRDTRES